MFILVSTMVQAQQSSFQGTWIGESTPVDRSAYRIVIYGSTWQEFFNNQIAATGTTRFSTGRAELLLADGRLAWDLRLLAPGLIEQPISMWAGLYRFRLVQNSNSQNDPNNERIYRIGDFGPAGGLVFYDKGIFSNGWRYIEVAPLESEFKVYNWYWEDNVIGTRTGIGFGRQNTQLIVEYLNRLGVTGNEAQLCYYLNFDGFDDWFLPSKDELDLIYRNLYLRNLGGFTNYYYCSSSMTGEYLPDWIRSPYVYVNTVWKKNFRDGSDAGVLIGGGSDEPDFYVRAIRYF